MASQREDFAPAWGEFDDADRMRASPFYNRIIDVMQELTKFTHLTRDRSDYLTNRYSERVESTQTVPRNRSALGASEATASRRSRVRVA